MRHLSQLQAPALAGADMIDLHLGETGNTGSPKYIADTVLFLAENDFITGENIVVDGGRSLGPSHR